MHPSSLPFFILHPSSFILLLASRRVRRYHAAEASKQRMLPKTKLQFALTAILALAVFGTVGFRLLLGTGWVDSFYFTLITLTTVGYAEPAEMTQNARYFPSALIVLGVGPIGYTLSAPAQARGEAEVVT